MSVILRFTSIDVRSSATLTKLRTSMLAKRKKGKAFECSLQNFIKPQILLKLRVKNSCFLFTRKRLLNSVTKTDSGN